MQIKRGARRAHIVFEQASAYLHAHTPSKPANSLQYLTVSLLLCLSPLRVVCVRGTPWRGKWSHRIEFPTASNYAPARHSHSVKDFFALRVFQKGHTFFLEFHRRYFFNLSLYTLKKDFAKLPFLSGSSRALQILQFFFPSFQPARAERGLLWQLWGQSMARSIILGRTCF